MEKGTLLELYRATRRTTEDICSPLQTEDYVVQSMEDVSPPKWHLGHTTWFFEKMLLQGFRQNYKPVHPKYDYIFNSYYESVGDRWLRPRRGLLSRPTVKDVYEYRKAIDGRMTELIESVANDRWPEFEFITMLGIHHEQQHQELLFTDFKHILAINPLRPAYKTVEASKKPALQIPSRFVDFAGGITDLGYAGIEFSFDNERPRHKVLLQDYTIKNRLVTNGEYLEFMNSGGYTDYRHWLSDAWYVVNDQKWNAPMYWEQKDGEWQMMTLTGMRTLNPEEPVCHVSYYEADAFARWSGKRLPNEAEWENAARTVEHHLKTGNFQESGEYHPRAAEESSFPILQMFGDVWEWTTSAYLPYPGFRPETGAISEYNGKFMSSQMVLRGGSCVTPVQHIRSTYRNFFQPDKRWQFMGIRLAGDR